MAKCEALNRNGGKCGTPKLPNNSNFCWFHEPSLAAARHDAASRGGKSNGNVPLETPGQVATMLATMLNQLRKGQLDTKAASSVSYLSRILLDALAAKADVPETQTQGVVFNIIV